MRVAGLVLALTLTTALPAAARLALPVLTAQDDDGSVSLPIVDLRIDVLIRGHLARTTYEITFRNDLDRDLDGKFSFPLPPDAEVSELGLYFNGVLRHAVAVERVQARAAYEETVHRRVDPALAEWSASTRAFHFRVYPIPARGTKVVHIAYDQDLSSAPYELDLRHGLSLQTFELTIDGDADVDSEGLPMRRSGQRWSAKQTNAQLDAIVRATRDANDSAFAAWSPEDKAWLYSAPVNIRSHAQPLAPASEVLVLYDVSASAVQRDDVSLHAFLRTFLERQSAQARVTVVPFHVRVDSPFETDAIALEHRLSSLPHAGATNLVALFDRLPEIARATAPDTRIVLITDGMHTLGDSASLTRAIDAASRIGRPIAVVNASPSANDTTLARIASATGGWNIDLTKAAASEVVNAAMQLPKRVAVRAAGPGIRELMPAAISTDFAKTIHARSSQLLHRLPLALGNVRRELVVRELFTDEERALVRQSWARAILRSLLERGASDDEVREHGLHFRQLTPQTSLLILDTWRDYDAYGIPLPPDLRMQREHDLAIADAEQRRRGKVSSMRMRGADADAASQRAVWFIKGTVTDNEEFVLPGVTVEMLIDGAPVVTTVTDSEGRFWINAHRKPASFEIRARLEGFVTATHSYSRGTPKGAVIHVLLGLAALSEAITVTADAPAVEGAETTVRHSSIVRPNAAAMIDPLLAGFTAHEEITIGTSIEDRAAQIQHVVERLRSLRSTEERFRYYLAARSAIGGNKYLQAEAALTMYADAPELAVRALTDLAESYPDDAPTLRLLGRVLDGWGFRDLARLLFERALELSPRETPTWRELLLLAAKENRSDDLAELQHRFKATQLDRRMGHSESAVDLELQRSNADRRVDERSELQVEVMWDANYTDIDLHVLEPSGESVDYRNSKSKSGGSLREDVTTGYGPETYTLPQMESGKYEIALSYYLGDNTRLGRQTLAHVIVYVRGERRDFFVPLVGERDRIVVATVSR